MRSKIVMAMVLGLAVSGLTYAQSNSSSGQQGEGNMPPPPPAFSSVDSNGDSEISLAEFSAQDNLPPGADADTVFSDMDSNSDGAVSQDEYEGFRPPRQPQRQ